MYLPTAGTVLTVQEYDAKRGGKGVVANYARDQSWSGKKIYVRLYGLKVIMAFILLSYLPN